MWRRGVSKSWRLVTRSLRIPLDLWSRAFIESRILLTSAGLFVAITFVLSYLRHLTYQTNAWDLGIYMQSLWSTAFRRDFFYYTAELSWNGSGSLFGVHFMPIIWLLVPIYALVPGAAVLFVIQSTVVAASVFPMYYLLLARTERKYALGLSLAYLVSPPLLAGVFFDFHIEAFLPVTTLCTWLTWERRNYRLLPIPMAAMLAVIEFAPVVLSAMGLMFLVKAFSARRKARKTGTPFSTVHLFIPIAVIPLGLVLMFVFFSIPKIVSPATPPLITVGPLGGTLSEILRNILTNPGLVLTALSINAPTKVLYLLGIWVAALGFWIIKPIDGLPALPWILVALLTTHPLYAVPASNQYGFLVVPFLFPATATGLQALLKRMSSTGTQEPTLGPRTFTVRSFREWVSALRKPALAVLALLVIASQISMNPVSPLSFSWQGVGRLPGEHESVVRMVMDLIPGEASVSAQPDLFPHVANRRGAYPYLVPGVQFVVVDLTSWWFTSEFPPPSSNAPWIEQLRGNALNAYGLLASIRGVLLFQLEYRGTPVIFEPFNVRVPPDHFVVDSATLVRDESSPLGSLLVPRGYAPNMTFWHGPYVLLPVGVFETRIWLRAPIGNTEPIELTASIDEGGRTLFSMLLSPDSIEPAWTPLLWTLTMPHPAFLELVGVSVNGNSTIQFGGVELIQLPQPAVLGGEVSPHYGNESRRWSHFSAITSSEYSRALRRQASRISSGTVPDSQTDRPL